MAHYDLPLHELATYRSSVTAPDDFDVFWRTTLRASRDRREPLRQRALNTSLTEVDVRDIRFSGFAGHPIAAWLLLPKSRNRQLPVVVSFLGYGGGRGLPESWTQFPSAGFAQLVVDSRGQGSGYRPGDTADAGVSGPHSGGVMTLGLDRREDYYYRRLFTDAVLSLDALDEIDEVDSSRIIVQGGSQGGAIALAVVGLSDRPVGALIDVPFLCDVPRAIRLVDSEPYAELVRYLRIHRDAVDSVQETLRTFDGVVFAERAHASALFSVGLMDDICPPSTVFGAYNAYSGAKSIVVYPFNGHENGEELQARRGLEFARSLVD